MEPWQLLPGQMSQWQCKSVQNGPRNLPLKFGSNRASNSWDITDMEFVWVGGVQSHFHIKPNFRWIVIELTLSWGFDKNSLQAHVYIQTDTSGDHCSYCEKNYKNKNSLWVHKYRSHEQSGHRPSLVSSCCTDGWTTLGPTHICGWHQFENVSD